MFTIKPTKEESQLINWLRKAVMKDTSRPPMNTLLVKNGRTIACDGYRIHMTFTPECLKKQDEAMILPVDKGPIRANCFNEFEVITEGNYLNIDQVMPKGQPVFIIGVNPKFLIEALQGFPETAILSFYSSHEPFTVTSKGTENEAVIMPVYLGEEIAE